MCLDWMCCLVLVCVVLFFFKLKTAYELRISDWSSDVCSSDLSAKWVQTGIATLPRSNLPACSKVAPRDIPTVSRREGRSQDWVHCLQLARHEDQPASRKIALRPVSRNKIGRASWRARVCQYV